MREEIKDNSNVSKVAGGYASNVGGFGDNRTVYMPDYVDTFINLYAYAKNNPRIMTGTNEYMRKGILQNPLR